MRISVIGIYVVRIYVVMASTPQRGIKRPVQLALELASQLEPTNHELGPTLVRSGLA